MKEKKTDSKEHRGSHYKSRKSADTELAPKPTKSSAEVANEAAKLGLSYGQYVARYNL